RVGPLFHRPTMVIFNVRALHQTLTLLANGLNGESSKTRDASSTGRITHQPGAEARHIHRRCGGHMPQMSLFLPNVATPTKVKDTSTLSNGPFDAGPFGIPLF